jgi:RNA 2',3'-cyclic 3'-phosphodiesterase
MPRLFIAIDLPEVVRQELCRLNVPIPGSRWVPADQLHLTLAFLGDVGEERVAGLARALGQVSAAPFRLRFDRLGCFPSRARPRVLWVGLKPEPLLISLADRLRELLRASDIPQEERPFSPHITLARLKLPAARECASFLDRPLALERTSVPVVEFILFESRLTAAGAIHTPLKRFPLSGGSCGPPA